MRVRVRVRVKARVRVSNAIRRYAKVGCAKGKGNPNFCAVGYAVGRS